MGRFHEWRFTLQASACTVRRSARPPGLYPSRSAMNRRAPSLFTSTFIAILLVSAGAWAQGVTGSAVTGVVRDPDGAPVPEAQVQLRNPTTGDLYNAVTGADGVYNFDNVQPGGPY